MVRIAEANQDYRLRSPFTHEKEPIILMLDIINETAYIKLTFKAGFV
jgi:hypothetical protein